MTIDNYWPIYTEISFRVGARNMAEACALGLAVLPPEVSVIDFRGEVSDNGVYRMQAGVNVPQATEIDWSKLPKFSIDQRIEFVPSCTVAVDSLAANYIESAIAERTIGVEVITQTKDKWRVSFDAEQLDLMDLWSLVSSTDGRIAFAICEL